MLIFEAFKMELRTARFKKDHHCPVCGDNPEIKEFQRYDLPTCEIKIKE